MGQIRIWAENEVYGSGHGSFTGLANKADPGATIAADGIVPGEEFRADHLNHQLHEHSLAAIQARNAALRTYELVQGQTFTSPFQGIGAAYIDHLGLTGFCAGGEFYLVGDSPFATNPGNSNVDSLCNVLMYDEVTQRLVMIGTGTDNSAYSDNDGATWTTSTTETSAGCHVGLWLAEDVFMGMPAESIATGVMLLSTDGGDNWAPLTAIDATDDVGRGLCRCGLTNNAVLIYGLSHTIYTADETDTYTAWTNRGSIPDVGSLVTKGWVASSADGTAYLIAEYGDGIRLYSLATPSSAWQAVSTIDTSTLPTINDMQLYIDQQEGLMHVFLSHGATRASIYSSTDGGLSWSGPGALLGTADEPALCFATAGRLYYRLADDTIVRTSVAWSAT